MKKLLWTLVVALTSTAMAAFSVRVLERAYRRIMKHPPPEIPRWARMLVSPIHKRLAHPAWPG
jgi:hypothetical protein